MQVSLEKGEAFVNTLWVLGFTKSFRTAGTDFKNPN